MSDSNYISADHQQQIDKLKTARKKNVKQKS